MQKNGRLSYASNRMYRCLYPVSYTHLNTTPEEVRREMQIAIDTGFDNPDPAVQEEWKKMTLKGERPTPEEVIKYAVKKTKRKIKI